MPVRPGTNARQIRQPDQRDREADCVECPDASGEDWSKRGEEPKAEHGDRDEQSDHGMGHAQRALNLRYERTDSDELWSVHERSDEQTNQQWQAIANRLNRKATRRLLVCSHRGRMAERARVGPAARRALNLERWCPRAPTVGIRVGHELTLQVVHCQLPIWIVGRRRTSKFDADVGGDTRTGRRDAIAIDCRLATKLLSEERWGLSLRPDLKAELAVGTVSEKAIDTPPLKATGGDAVVRVERVEIDVASLVVERHTLRRCLTHADRLALKAVSAKEVGEFLRL